MAIILFKKTIKKETVELNISVFSTVSLYFFILEIIK